MRHTPGPLAAVAAAVMLPSLAGASTDKFTISPADSDVCVGTNVDLDLCTRPGDIGLLLISSVPGTTVIPGIGTFAVPLTPFPTILELGAFPGDGCIDITKMVPCDREAVVYNLQGVSVNPLTMNILISNAATLEIKTLCQDWDGDGINDACNGDCDGDGVIDGLELDSDGDDIPNDCDEDCEEPHKPCDEGCWQLSNKPPWSGGPVGEYGLRLDGLFGDHSDSMYTFSFEWPGTDVQTCYDKDDKTITLKGVVYGGLGLAPDWDPNLQGYALVEFTWCGAKCKDNKKLVVKKSDGGGSGSFTWLATGEVLELEAKADDDYYVYLDKDDLFYGSVKFACMPDECCQIFKAEADGVSSCP